MVAADVEFGAVFLVSAVMVLGSSGVAAVLLRRTAAAATGNT
jgi:hypothetical protein